ncbi:MAG: DEAD/DEAH box helicase family protein [Cyanobacteriota bacterium]|nr:DEAD/DEAH box helicase family protein [Cyanobacteriota bacterium]
MVLPSFELAPCAVIRPRQWQAQLIQLLRARLLRPEPGGHDVLVHAGPGAGKTLGALLGFQTLAREGRLERLIVFCHRQTIGAQWLAAAARLGVPLQEWGGETLATGGHLLISYQAAARHLRRLTEDPPKGPWLAVADEVHHLGFDPLEPEASAWGQAFTHLSAAARLRLGLSGTPFRADHLAFCAARRIRVHDGDGTQERIVPDLCVEPRRLIVAGDVRPLQFRFQDGWVEHGRQDEGGERESSPLSAETRESWRARNLRRAIRPGDAGGIALRLLLQARGRLQRLRQDHGRAAGLVIARDIDHARTLATLLRQEGDRVELVHSQDPEAALRLQGFETGSADWLVSIDMAAEGFDAPRIRVIAYLSTVVTRSRFLQAITRAVRLDGERAAVEPIPRHPSYVYAPADPLLIAHARTWSLSEPYLIRGPMAPVEPGVPVGGSAGSLPPLKAMADDAGAVIRMTGPQLPDFLATVG